MAFDMVFMAVRNGGVYVLGRCNSTDLFFIAFDSLVGLS